MIEKSLEKLAKKVDTENLGYEDINTLASDLLDKKVNDILIDSTDKVRFNKGISQGANNKCLLQG